MFTLLEPTEKQVGDFLAAQRRLPFSYAEVGDSKDKIPAGYPINHRRIRLGSGADVFERARNAVQNWAMYDLDWTRVFPDGAPIVVGEVVCVVVNHGFCRSINPCRIVYVSEESANIERYAFAFGTLPGHSEEGEERFSVEWRRADDSVWFELISFARPHHILAKIGFPFVPLFQKKFAADAGRAMLEAVGEK